MNSHCHNNMQASKCHFFCSAVLQQQATIRTEAILLRRWMLAAIIHAPNIHGADLAQPALK